MIVAGVDPSLTSAGVAVLRDGKPVHVSHHGFPGHNASSDMIHNRRLRHQAHKVRTAVLAHGRPDLVVMERALTAMAGGKPFDRYTLGEFIFATLDELKIPVVKMHNATAKVWIAGNGHAKKSDIIAAVTSWWPGQPIANDDEADALGLAAIGAFHLGDPMPFEVKDRHRTALEKVSWP